MAHRLFVAVRPPDKVLDAVDAVTGAARRSMVGPRWTDREQWHLTLQFLGSVDDDTLPGVARALEALSAIQPFPARLGGGGAFPSAKRGRVIWLGVVGGAAGLEQLAQTSARVLEPLGFAPEARPFHAHLTLARLRTPGDVAPAVEALGADPVGPAFTVSEVVLYESHVRRSGAQYEPVTRFALVG